MNSQQVFTSHSEQLPDDIWLGPYTSVMYHAKRLGFKDPWIIHTEDNLKGHKPTVRLHLCMGLKHIIYESNSTPANESIQSFGLKALRRLAQEQKRNRLRRMANRSEESTDDKPREINTTVRRSLDWMGDEA